MMLQVLVSLTETVAETVSENGELSSAPLSPEALAALAIGLLFVALCIMILEFFVVSGGLISALAIFCAIIAIALGFRVDPVMGWAMLVISPILFMICVRLGLRRLQGSSLVTQATVDGNAGYEQVAHHLGITVGSHGTLSTDAMPTGRCRFSGGEVDVSLESGTGRRGERVRVYRIDGPEVWVRSSPTENKA